MTRDVFRWWLAHIVALKGKKKSVYYPGKRITTLQCGLDMQTKQSVIYYYSWKNHHPFFHLITWFLTLEYTGGIRCFQGYQAFEYLAMSENSPKMMWHKKIHKKIWQHSKRYLECHVHVNVMKVEVCKSLFVKTGCLQYKLNLHNCTIQHLELWICCIRYVLRII